jgi:putative acetyltransferase
VTAPLKKEVAAAATIRPIASGDNPAVAALIHTVMPEFGAVGEGFAIMDPEVDVMCETYRKPRAAYAVVEVNGLVVGGAGVAPLKGGDEDTCELQKMYVLPTVRRQGVGRRLIEWCLGQARAAKFKRCYLETLGNMDAARRLYEEAGFKPIDGPLGNTGHYKCNRWYVKALD